MSSDTRDIQEQLRRRFAAPLSETPTFHKVGISQSSLDGVLPLNGLRHPVTNGVSGWYIYGGLAFSQAPDFFMPMHVSHLKERCPLALKFLLLPPGWRFLTDGDYEDIWFDEALLIDGE
ncbi:hypothetical protein [Shimia sp. NS0008-38b]|uniref:immunity protein Imm33 domain-containing protein n=1 Tax=Shimia sp. NS0008-38b TaxID=3127653 RepID=UPI0033421ED4